MCHYLLRADAYPGHWRVVFVQDVPLDALRVGLPMETPGRPARVVIAPEGDRRSDWFEVPCVALSDAMRRALDGAGVDNVQYFPAQFVRQYAGDEGLAEYWLANVVGALACAAPLTPEAARDREARGIAPGPSPGFAVNAARTYGLPLFRLAEDRSLLVVSERVADALYSAGLQGVVLQAPEDYNGLAASTAPRAPGPPPRR